MNIETALEQASTLLGQGRLGEAALAYKKITEAAPQCGDAWLMLGSLQRQAGNLQRAEACYRAAVELNSQDIKAVSAWCASAVAIKRPTESDGLLQTLLDEQYDNSEIWFQLAIMCSKLGRHAEAVDCIDKAAANAPGAHKYILGKADILERRGDFDQAFDILEPYLQAAQPNIGAVLVFSRFSHVVGLRLECITLLKRILVRKTITPEARREVTKALDMVSKASSLS